jgi:hypothetical protein
MGRLTEPVSIGFFKLTQEKKARKRAEDGNRFLNRKISAEAMRTRREIGKFKGEQGKKNTDAIRKRSGGTE